MKTIHIKIHVNDNTVIGGDGPCQYGKNGFLRIYNFLVPIDFQMNNLIFNNTILPMIDSGAIENKELNIKRILFYKTFKKIL